MYVAITKKLISCAVTAQLICAFVFDYACCWFSHAKAQLVLFFMHNSKLQQSMTRIKAASPRTVFL